MSLLQAREEVDLARAEYDRFREREDRRSSDKIASIDANDYAARLVVDRQEENAESSGAKEAEPDSVLPGGLVFREPQLRAAEAALQRSKAMLSNAQLSSSRTVVRAPFSGFIRNKSVAVGSFLAPGQSFAQLVASDIYEISIPMTREEAALIPDLWSNRQGERNTASVFADYGGLRYRWPGYIDRAEAVLNPETRTINVVVRVPSPTTSGRQFSSGMQSAAEGMNIMPTQAPPLLMGEFVTVEINGGALERYYVVPRSALKEDESIWVVRDGRIEISPVEILQQADDNAFVIAEGLAEGDEIVVSDLSVATQGMEVRVESAANAASPATTSNSTAE
ncbi:MAG: HlyD family efflux transporter periplasmic adaptor subunit [Rhodothermales bacterium]|nr:HlyD family efflux transporter periplasmic adaptor subunit [Rhodothermales bacterium]